MCGRDSDVRGAQVSSVPFRRPQVDAQGCPRSRFDRIPTGRAQFCVGAESNRVCLTYPGQGARKWATSTMTICPKGRSVRALSDICGPRCVLVLANKAWQGAMSGLAAPDADVAVAPSTPRVASTRTVSRCCIGSLLYVVGQRN